MMLLNLFFDFQMELLLLPFIIGEIWALGTSPTQTLVLNPGVFFCVHRHTGTIVKLALGTKSHFPKLFYVYQPEFRYPEMGILGIYVPKVDIGIASQIQKCIQVSKVRLMPS